MKFLSLVFLTFLVALLLAGPAGAQDESAEFTIGTPAFTATLSELQRQPDSFQQDDDFLSRLMDSHFLFPYKPFAARDSAQTFSPLGAAQTNAPKLYRSFKGIGATGFEPADPSIAVGPDRVVTVVNRSIAIYSKLGQKVYQATLRDFFRPLPDSQSVSILYPKVMYDASGNHFLVLIEAVRTVDKKSWYFLAVSKTTNPAGDWAYWELNMGLNGGAQSGFYADYPGFGLDQQAIYLTANMANWENRFQYSKIRILKKSEVYKFGKVTWKDFFKLQDATGAKAVSIQPAQSFGTAPAGYLINSVATGGSMLTLWTITSPASAPVLNKKGVTVSAYTVPPDAQQKGGPLKIGTGDASLGNAVYRDGLIYTAHTIAKTFGTSTYSVVRYYQIGTDGGVAQEVTYGAGGKYYSFPAVAVDSHGNAALVFNNSSGGQFVSVLFTGRKATDAKNTLQPSAILQSGKSYYHLTTRQVQYWGAYNGIATDYDDSIWMVGAFAKAPDEWDTYIGKVSY